MFSARGWRTREPGGDDIAPEKPALAQSIYESLRLKGMSEGEVASIAGFADAKRNDLFKAPGLRIV